MRQVDGFRLWIGTARDARDIKLVLANEIETIADLAMEEPPVVPNRELVCLRFPLRDGIGNPPWMLRSAVTNIVELQRQNIPTLVACSAGMSRSPAVVAMAIARLRGIEPAEVLANLSASGPTDVSPGLWQELLASFL